MDKNILWVGFVSLVIVDLVTKHVFFDPSAHVLNSGVFLGLFSSSVWLVLPVFLIGYLLYEMGRAQSKILQYGYVLLAAGGTGNWIDRLYYGSVRDFIYYPIINVWGNVADIYITISFIVLLYAMYVGTYE